MKRLLSVTINARHNNKRNLKSGAQILYRFDPAPDTMAPMDTQQSKRPRGRPRVLVEDRRTSKITVRLTPAQRQFLERRAELHGVSTSSYIVGRALGNSLRPAFAQDTTPFMPMGS